MYVCVERLNRRKTSYLSLLFRLNFKFCSRWTQHFTGTVSNEATSEMGYPVWLTGRTCDGYIFEDAFRSQFSLVLHEWDSVPDGSLC